MTDFNFITEPVAKTEPLIPEIETPVGELSKLVKMTPRKFAQAVLDVFEELGGAMWLITQAKTDPRGFMDLLKKILPRNIQAEGLEGITVRLVDQYGNAIEIDTHRGIPCEASAKRGGQPVATSGNFSVPSGTSPSESGQLQIATGGTPDVVLKETYN